MKTSDNSADLTPVEGRTDIALNFVWDVAFHSGLACIVARTPAGATEIRTFDFRPKGKDDTEDLRRFIDERQGEANLFVLPNCLKAPIDRLPMPEDIGAAQNVRVRLSPNPHFAVSADGFRLERERLQDSVSRIWREMVKSRAPATRFIDDGQAYWIMYDLSTPIPLAPDWRPLPGTVEYTASSNNSPRYHYDPTVIDPRELEQLAEWLATGLGGDLLLKDLQLFRQIPRDWVKEPNDPDALWFWETQNSANACKVHTLIECYGTPVECVHSLLPIPGTIALPTPEQVERLGLRPTLVREMEDDKEGIGDRRANYTRAELEIVGSRLRNSVFVDQLFSDLGRERADRLRFAFLKDPELKNIWDGTATDDVGCRLGGEELTTALVSKLKENHFSSDDAYLIFLTFGHGHESYFFRAWSGKSKTSNWLEDLNAKHFTVVEDGKSIVYTPRHDPMLNRRVLERSTHRDLEQIYSGSRMTVAKGRDASVATLWLRHPAHRDYPGGVAFLPEKKAPEGVFNLWLGWGVLPRRGDWAKLRAHIRDNICNGNEAHFQYLLGWMATAVQHPGEPGHVAIVLRGGRGVGKGKLANWFGKLFGQHWVHVASSKALVGNFNAHLRDAIFVFADEAYFAGDKSHESVLKAMITESTLMIEAKFHDVVMARNCIHLLIASNDEWVVPAGIDERRFFALDVAPHRQGDSVYFGTIDRQMESGGAEAMLYDLLHMDLSGFNVRKAPSTEALVEQKLHSLDSTAKWLLDYLTTGELPGTTFGGDWSMGTDVDKDALYVDYTKFTSQGRMYRVKSKSEFGKRLKQIIGGLQTKRARAVDEDLPFRRNLYSFPPLEECRADFERLIGSKIHWEQ